MTPEETANLKKVLNHALTHGEAYMLDGKFVDSKEIYKDGAQLRAEKIWRRFNEKSNGIVVFAPDFRDFIAAEINDAVREAYEDAAKIAEAAPMQPGAVIYVAEVRRTEPFVKGQEWADHIAKQIRARAKNLA